jgi:TorA maturation chaperone TorD
MDIEQLELTEDQAPLLARRTLYGFFSIVFGDPHHDRFRELEAEAVQNRVLISFDLLDGESQRVAPTGEDELLAHDVDVNELLTEWDHESIRDEYREVFGLTISEDCPPHEVEYCEKTDLFYRSQLMADVGAFFSAFGLEINDEAPERIDHVRLELEFLQHLLTKRLHGESNDHDPEDLETIEDAAREFFEEHVGWWVPAFGQAVEGYPKSETYADLARLLRWFMTQERLRFDLPVFVERPEPNVPDREPQGTCFECAVDEEAQPAV